MRQIRLSIAPLLWAGPLVVAVAIQIGSGSAQGLEITLVEGKFEDLRSQLIGPNLAGVLWWQLLGAKTYAASNRIRCQRPGTLLPLVGNDGIGMK